MTSEAPGRDKRTGGDPQNADTSSVGEPSRDSEFPRRTLDDVLDCLGWANGEHTAVCHKPVDGNFSSAALGSVNARPCTG